MVTGQNLGTPMEAICAEAGVSDYATIRKGDILIASEKALRTSGDHPSNIAFRNKTIKLRLKRCRLRVSAEGLPPAAENRRQIDLTTIIPPWEKHHIIQIRPADKSTKKFDIPDAKLRADTLAKDSKAD